MVAGSHVRVVTDTRLTGDVEVSSFAAGGLLWSSADANHSNDPSFDNPRGLQITGTSNVEIGAGAVLDAVTVSLKAEVSRLSATALAGAEAIVVLLVGVGKAYAEANVELDVVAQVIIKGSATTQTETTITGSQGVDVLARVSGVSVLRKANRLGVGIIPPQAAVAGVCDSSQGFKCFEVLEGASANWDEGTLRVKALVTAEEGAHIFAGPRSNDPRLERPDRTASGAEYPGLALFVDAQMADIGDVAEKWRVWTASESEPVGAFAPGRVSDVASSATITWDADVTVLGGTNGTPRLVVDELGIVRSVNNVFLLCDAGDTRCGTDGRYALKVGDEVNPVGDADPTGYRLADITNSGFGGILFSSRSPSGDRHDDAVKNADSNAHWPLFDFKVTLAGAFIVDRSDLNLTINLIDLVLPVDSTAKPIVWVVTADDKPTPAASPQYAFEFDVQRSAGEGFVDIQKLGDGDLTLNGS